MTTDTEHIQELREASHREVLDAIVDMARKVLYDGATGKAVTS